MDVDACAGGAPSHKHSCLVSPFSHFLNILFLPYCYFKERILGHKLAEVVEIRMTILTVV